MKTVHLLVLLTLFTVGHFTNAQTFEWVKQMGGTSEGRGNSVAVDASGNVYTTGYFEGTADFDPGTGTFNLSSAGRSDIFISKLDASGDLVWAKQLGGTNWDEGFSIAVDDSGNVYTTGHFRGTVDFDPGANTFNLSTTGVSNVFILKLDSSGDFVWAKQLGGISDDQGYSITVDALGNVYATGSLKGIINFDPGTGAFFVNTSKAHSMFVLKLDASGDFVWAKQLGGNGEKRGFSIAVDDSGNVYTTGYFTGTVDFDPGDGTFTLKAAGYWDIFVWKLDASGDFVWAKQLGGKRYERGHSIAVDAAGNVYTTGIFQGIADFDPGPDTFNLITADGDVVGGDGIFISKLDALGNFVWAKQMSGRGHNDRGYSIAVDAIGNVYTTGWFDGTVDFDPGPDTFNLITAGRPDVFISKLDASGNFVWAKQLGGNHNDQGRSIAVDTAGNIYTTGFFEGTADFDPSPGIFNLNPAGSRDIFVHKISQSTEVLSLNSNEKKYTVYPNPTSGPINIALGESTLKTEVVVRNYLGQEVLRRSYALTDLIQLTIGGAAGLYLVEIKENDKNTVIKVVKH